MVVVCDADADGRICWQRWLITFIITNNINITKITIDTIKLIITIVKVKLLDFYLWLLIANFDDCDKF